MVVVKDLDVSNAVSHWLDQDSHVDVQARVISIVRVINVPSHNVNEHGEGEDETKEENKERNELTEDSNKHINDEIEVRVYPDVVQEFGHALNEAEDSDQGVNQLHVLVAIFKLDEVKVQPNMKQEGEDVCEC